MLKDHLGSASVVTDVSGNIVGEQRYYPFGETRLATDSMYTDKLFTGQRNIAGLGIYHYQSRFYSPKLGRFLSADSLVPNPFNPQDYNRFAYVRNNPVRYIDPSGHVCSDPEDPTPTCDNSFLSTTKVGNKMVKGSGLDAGKPKVVKKNQGNKPLPLDLPGGGDPNLPTVTYIPTYIPTPTITSTPTVTSTPTSTFTPTNTATSFATNTPTATSIPSNTPTNWAVTLPYLSPTQTSTYTPTSSVTPTFDALATSTITPTPTYDVPFGGGDPCEWADLVCSGELDPYFAPPGGGAGGRPSYDL